MSKISSFDYFSSILTTIPLTPTQTAQGFSVVTLGSNEATITFTNTDNSTFSFKIASNAPAYREIHQAEIKSVSIANASADEIQGYFLRIF